ncbi:response regulator [Streptomyces silvensis]|uniref:response regulator n=1 Tax=Streptomyces silvensis TaxID=1765722 RepID=UPI001F5284B5|nr:response regulator transcription factor [Streptomyces silvensis]
MTVRVVLADDQTVVRAGFRALLDLTDYLVVIAEAADGLRAVEAVRTTRPDVDLMDIRMPGVDGIEATRRIAADRVLDLVRVNMLTTYRIDEYVFEALRHGAAGFTPRAPSPPSSASCCCRPSSARSSATRSAGARVSGVSPTAALEGLTQTSGASADTGGQRGEPACVAVAAAGHPVHGGAAADGRGRAAQEDAQRRHAWRSRSARPAGAVGQCARSVRSAGRGSRGFSRRRAGRR